MSKKNILIAICILIVSLLSAQDELKKNWSFMASYYSLELTNPGIRLGVERPFFVKEKNNNALSSLYYHGSLGTFFLKDTRHNLFLDLGIGYKRTGGGNFIHGVETGLMSVTTYNDGNDVEIGNPDDDTEVTWSLSSYYALRFHYELGYQISNRYALSVKPGVFLKENLFEAADPRFTFEVAFKYTLIR